MDLTERRLVREAENARHLLIGVTCLSCGAGCRQINGSLLSQDAKAVLECRSCGQQYLLWIQLLRHSTVEPSAGQHLATAGAAA